MALNHYFNNQPNTTTGEQAFYEDLINEAISIRGHNVYYILRESRDEVDMLFGEDPTSKFTNYFVIEMYIKNTRQFDGEEDMLTKFGLEIHDNIKFLVTGRAFNRVIPQEIAIRPREGDLIYSTLFNKMFEITFAKNDPIFYALGRRSVDQAYFYELTCETFKFSHEKISTGVAEIDSIPQKNAYAIELYMAGSSSTQFMITEEVLQANSGATAVVSDWNPTNKILKLINIKGQFEVGDAIIGLTTNTTLSLASFDPITNASPESVVDNLIFEEEANTEVISIETNPFGMPS